MKGQMKRHKHVVRKVSRIIRKKQTKQNGAKLESTFSRPSLYFKKHRIDLGWWVQLKAPTTTTRAIVGEAVRILPATPDYRYQYQPPSPLRQISHEYDTPRLTQLRYSLGSRSHDPSAQLTNSNTDNNRCTTLHDSQTQLLLGPFRACATW